MLTEAHIVETIEQIAAGIPGFVGASLVDLDSGITLGLHTVDERFDLSSASAYNSEIVKQKQKIMQALGLQMELEDITMTLSEQIHVIKLVTEATFLYLAADKASTNLALIRNSIAKHAAALAG